MVFPRLKHFANKKGWKIEKNCIYGEENGYLFTLFDGNGFKGILTPLPHIDNQTKQNIISFLEEHRKQLKLWKYEFDNYVLVTKIRESIKSTQIEVIEELIRTITEFLKNHEIPGVGYCIICGKDKANQIVSIENIYYYIHDLCCINVENEIESAKDQFESEEKNYSAGFLGALLGGIISSIPWIIVQIVFSRIAPALAYLIGLGAFKLYTIFKGKLGPLTKWIISIIVLFSVIIAQFCIISIELIKAGIPLTYNNFLLLFYNQESLRMIKTNLSLALFMALLGISPILFELKGSAKNNFPKIKKEK